MVEKLLLIKATLSGSKNPVAIAAIDEDEVNESSDEDYRGETVEDEIEL